VILARRRHSLGLRFMLMVLLCTTLFASAGGVLAWHLGYQRAVAQSRDTLGSLALAVDRTVAIGLYARDNVLVAEIVDGLVRNERVAAVEVLSARGEVVVRRADDTAAPGPAEQDTVLRRPILSPFDAHERIGELRLIADAASLVAEARAEALRLTWMMAGQAVLLAALLYAVMSALVTNPIIRLARLLQHMVPGQTERLPVSRVNQHDEIGQLIRSANTLLETNAEALARERALREEVQAMEAQYRKIFDASSAGIFVLDSEGRLINGNPTVFRVLGRSLGDLRALDRGSFLQEAFADPQQVREMIHRARIEGQTLSADLALRQSGTDVRWVHCLISVQAEPGAVPSAEQEAVVEGVMYDVTERKSAELAVRYQAEHDALTGLANRAASEAAIDRMVDEALSAGQPMALLFLDLDGFKQINDSHGHVAGDEVLVACAHAMQSAVRRGSDLVGRLGGDEFVVALRGIGADHPMLAATAQALLAAVGAPIRLADGQRVQVGVSIGVALCPRHGRDRASLTKRADVTLYQVKAHGKNAFAVAAGPVEASSEALQ
jgi:diguanylate cyclase (GGDEF)-like protein/PAS domain S-box-containing protein